MITVPTTGSDVSTTTWTTGTTSGAIPKPANTANGDVLVAVVYNQASGSGCTPPSGWTQRYHAVATSTRGLYIFTKPIPSAAAESATSYTFTVMTSARGCAIIFRMVGADNTTPLDAAPATDIYSSTAAATVNDPSVTAAHADALCFAVNFANGTGSVTHTFSASGFTAIAQPNTNSAGSTSSLGVQMKQLTATGATGAVTVTMTPSDSATNPASYGGFLITMNPAAIVAATAFSSQSSFAAAAGGNVTGASTMSSQSSFPDTALTLTMAEGSAFASQSSLTTGTPALTMAEGSAFNSQSSLTATTPPLTMTEGSAFASQSAFPVVGVDTLVMVEGASFASASSFGATTVATYALASSFASQSGLAAATTRTTSGASGFNSASSFAATTVATFVLAAAFASQSAFTSATILTMAEGSSFASQSSLTATTPPLTMAEGGGFASQSSFGATTTLTMAEGSAFASQSGFTATTPPLTMAEGGGFASQSSFAAATTRTTSGAAAFNSQSGFTATTPPLTMAEGAGFASQSSFSAADTVVMAEGSAFSSQSSLGATTVATYALGSSFNSASSFTAAAILQDAAAGAFASQSAFAATTVATFALAASFASASSLMAALFGTAGGGSAMNSQSSFASAPPLMTMIEGANFASQSALAAADTVVMAEGSAFSSQSTFTAAQPPLTMVEGSAFASQSSLVATTPPLTMAEGAGFASQSAFGATTVLTVSPSTAFASSSSFAAGGTRSSAEGSSFNSASALGAITVATFALSTTFASQSALGAVDTVVMAEGSAFASQSSLTATTPPLTMAEGATFASQSALAATTALTANLSAAFASQSALGAASTRTTSGGAAMASQSTFLASTGAIFTDTTSFNSASAFAAAGTRSTAGATSMGSASSFGVAPTAILASASAMASASAFGVGGVAVFAGASSFNSASAFATAATLQDAAAASFASQSALSPTDGATLVAAASFSSSSSFGAILSAPPAGGITLPSTSGDITTATWTSGTTTGAMAKPANVVDKDILVAVVYDQVSGSTITPPAGWTQQYRAVATGTRGFAVFTKPIPSAAAETATSYTFTTSNSSRGLAIIFRMVGANQSAFLDAAPTSDVYNSGASSTINDPAVSAVGASATLISFNFANGTGGTTHTFDGSIAGLARLTDVNVNNAGSTSSLGINYKQLSASGTTGAVLTALSASAASSGGFMMTFAPAIGVTSTAFASQSSFAGHPSGPISAGSSFNSQSGFAAQLTPVNPGAITFPNTAGDITFASYTSTTSFACSKPSNTADNDVLVAVAYDQISGSSFTAPAGWVLRDHAIATSARGLYIFTKVIPSAAAETATSYTFTASNAGRGCVTIFRMVGAAATVLDAAGGDVYNAGASATINDPAVIANNSAAMCLAINYANGVGGTVYTASAPGFTPLSNVNVNNAGSTSTLDVAYRQLTGTGSTGVVATTLSGSASSSGGLLMTFVPAANQAPPSTGFTSQSSFGATSSSIGPQSGQSAFASQSAFSVLTDTAVTKWVAQRPMEVAHRGAETDWDEETMYAYDNAAAWSPLLALEVSVWQCATGEYVCSHDQTTGRVFGTNLDIPTNSWATLSALRTTRNGKPIARITDVLASYGGKRIIWVDNKGQQNNSTLLDLLDSYGGKGWFIAKGFLTATVWAAAATARGYLTWGYGYSADVASNFPSKQGFWNLLGMDFTASSSDWASVRTYGKPILAHTINSAADRAAAKLLTSDGFMASSVVTSVIPGQVTSFASHSSFGAAATLAGPSTNMASQSSFGGVVAKVTMAESGSMISHSFFSAPPRTWFGTAAYASQSGMSVGGSTPSPLVYQMSGGTWHQYSGIYQRISGSWVGQTVHQF